MLNIMYTYICDVLFAEVAMSPSDTTDRSFINDIHSRVSSRTLLRMSIYITGTREALYVGIGVGKYVHQEMNKNERKN